MGMRAAGGTAARGRAGQSLVEFARTATLLLAAILIGLQLGLAAYAGLIVLPGAVQDGAAVAARRGGTIEERLERGRRRALGLIAAGGVAGLLDGLTVTATDLGETVEVRATGGLPLIGPFGGRGIGLDRRHAARKEALGAAD
jgi:hypothetical protein